MQRQNQVDPERRILTIPNILSFFRILLIPVFIWLYVIRQEAGLAGCVLALSGLTDIADGIIARRWHMTSDLGKILDPIADKLTQAVVLFCFIAEYPWMLAPLLLMIVKEFCMAVTGGLAIRRTGRVFGAAWHGKLATALLYSTMLLHLFWADISTGMSKSLAFVCTAFITISFILYMAQNLRLLRKSMDDGAPKNH